MSMFVLSIVVPSKGEAGYGKAWVSTPQYSRRDLITPAHKALREHNPHMPTGEASRYAAQITAKDIGALSVESSTGLMFRIDTAEDAPHPCPCCGRLVLPGDHAYAHDEDAYCLGCFTWDRNVDACLSENSAHISKEDRKE